MIVISPDRYSNRSLRDMPYRRRSPENLSRSMSDLDPSMYSKARPVLNYVNLARLCILEQIKWVKIFLDEYLIHQLIGSDRMSGLNNKNST
jgi:hypothetical protein